MTDEPSLSGGKRHPIGRTAGHAAVDEAEQIARDARLLEVGREDRRECPDFDDRPVVDA
jgi:hypothetical protein